MTKTCWGSLRFYVILVLFPFQIAPLIVIVCTASVGAIAFGVRQATKNPEAWYVITVFIKPDEKSSLQRTKQDSTKTETYLIWALFLISTDEVASRARDGMQSSQGFCLCYILFYFSAFSTKCNNIMLIFGGWRLLPRVTHDTMHEQCSKSLFLVLIRYKRRSSEAIGERETLIWNSEKKLRNYYS